MNSPELPINTSSTPLAAPSLKSEHSYRAYRWARANYTALGRLWDIGRFSLQLLWYLWQDQLAGKRRPAAPAEQQSQRNRQRAIWIRDSLLHLGPTFIKVGQFFSTRADLFAVEYIEELSKLQDRVPAFPYEEAAAIVERELGQPIGNIYAEFDPIPLASASLGQVHRARLNSGDEVAVKVQRPGLQQLFTIDLRILRQIIEFVQYRTQLGQGGRDWVGIYEECHRTLWEEVDYLNEGRNAATFYRNFRHRPEVVIPRVYWRYTSPKLLTMEYIPGIKVTDLGALSAAGIDRRTLAHLGATCYLEQVLHHGLFHADPHPGNLAVNAEGALIFYDFGMMGVIAPETKANLMLTFSGVLHKDANLVVQSMVGLGALASGTDLGPVRRSVQYMLETYFDQALAQHAEISVAAINDDLYELSYDQPFRFPATFTFVLRALATLEALGKTLDPTFNFMEVAQPFAEEIMAQDYSSQPNTFLDQLSRQATEFTNTSLSMPQRIETTLNKLEQGDLKLRFSAVETNRELRQLNTLGLGLIYTLLFCVLLITGSQFLLAGWLRVGGGLFGGAGLVAIALAQLLLFKLDRSTP